MLLLIKNEFALLINKLCIYVCLSAMRLTVLLSLLGGQRINAQPLHARLDLFQILVGSLKCVRHKLCLADGAIALRGDFFGRIRCAWIG